MTYEKLVEYVAKQAVLPQETVRAVLQALPDALILLKEGEQVRTPMGVFRNVKRAARNVRPPAGGKPVAIPPELVIKLRAGNKLRKDPKQTP